MSPSKEQRPYLRLLRSCSAYIVVLAVALLILRVSHNVLIQAGGLDAYIYTSYIQNYNDLANRYGLTYYSARVAHLYPAGLVVGLFGSHGGYFVYRYLLLCTALGATWTLARKNYGAAIALFAVAVASCQPWLLRSLFWDHYDSSGVVYLLLATAFLGSSRPEDHRRIFLAGGAFALAANCNAFLIGVGSILFFSYLVIYTRRRLSHALRLVALTVSGMIGFYLPLCAIHYEQLPSQGIFFDLLALRFGNSMVHGGARVWHSDVTILIQRGWSHLLVPGVVLLAICILLIARRRNQQPIVLFAALNLALVISLYVILDFGYQVGVISYFYYFIYLFPPTLFCLIVLFGELNNQAGHKNHWVLIGVGATLAVTGYIGYPWIEPVIYRMNVRWMAALIPLTLLGPALVNSRAKLGFVFTALAAVCSPLPFYKMPAGTYSAIHDGSPGVEWDVYRAALKLQQIVSRYPPSSGPVGFWYTNRPGSLLNSVQSMYLWGPSRIASPTDPKAGMPNLTHADLARLSQYRRICLLSEKADEIDQGMRALQAAGIKFRVSQHASCEGRNFRVDYLMLEQLDNAVSK